MVFVFVASNQVTPQESAPTLRFWFTATALLVAFSERTHVVSNYVVNIVEHLAIKEADISLRSV